MIGFEQTTRSVRTSAYLVTQLSGLRKGAFLVGAPALRATPHYRRSAAHVEEPPVSYSLPRHRPFPDPVDLDKRLTRVPACHFLA
jgi:hypothetical protein